MSRKKTPENELTQKKRAVYSPFHEKCGEFVRGNGSIVMPYECSCGTYEYDSDAMAWRLLGTARIVEEAS